MKDPERPDPDALLRRVQADEAKEKRARLKLFFGFAPGVGKTYAMLESARRLVAEGQDVVVGCVETHGRAETARLLEGLEVLPRRKVDYRGTVLQELDLAGALARRPRVLLVDELAHTNAPGSRHTKRWQDVVELLEAGIEVHTTLNVQHVESLNDVIAEITTIRVRETIPDSILERADEIELIDLPPDDLLARLREGKVYLADQAARAADSFFRRGNLLALRELALRRTAERVEADVQAYREAHAIDRPWAAAERILVCVGSGPGSGRLIRAARRLAAGLRAPWVAAYVAPVGAPPLGDEDRARLEGHLRLAESLGAEVAQLGGSTISEALLTFARQRNVTRIIVGKPTHTRLRDLIRGSLLVELVRGSGAIDVQVISGDDTPPEAPPPRPAPAPLDLGAYLGAGTAIGLATVISVLLDQYLESADIVMVYLLGIIVVALRAARAQAAFAAALAVAAYDFFFVEPRYTFAIGETRHLLTFGMMFGVGLVISDLMLRLRRQEAGARAREASSSALLGLTRELARAEDEPEAIDASTRLIERLTQGGARLVLADGSGRLQAGPEGVELSPAERGVAEWVESHGRPAGWGTDTLPGAPVVAFPLPMRASVGGVLLLSPGPGRSLDAEVRHLIDAILRQTGLWLERRRLAEEARAATLRARTEELRSSLLSTVSHDLRTPLAAITGAATTLLEGLVAQPAAQKELLTTIAEEAERLERLVANLLDMTRLESGALRVTREWVPVEELIGSALQRLEKRLVGRRVEIDLPAGLPLWAVDPVLFEQLLVNLIDNALKYTEGPISLSARVDQGLVLELRDRGPGIPEGTEARLFDKFYRGAHGGVAGSGLGLAIVRGIVEAHGGRIAAANREGGGAVFTVTMPLLESPPLPPEEAFP